MIRYLASNNIRLGKNLNFTRLGISFDFGQLTLKTPLPGSYLKSFRQTSSYGKPTDKQVVTPVSINTAPVTPKESNNIKLLINCGNYGQICCNNTGPPTKKQMQLCPECTGENEGACKDIKKPKNDSSKPRKCRKEETATPPCTVPGPPSEYPKRRRMSFKPKEPPRP